MAGESALEFLKKEHTVKDNGTLSVSQDKYFKYMQEQGVPKDVINAHNKATNELINGMYLLGDSTLTEKVAAAKKAGTDPKLEKSTVSVTIPSGSIQMQITAAKNYRNPRDPEAVITKTNVTQLDIKQHRQLDKDQVASCEDEMRKQLGL